MPLFRSGLRGAVLGTVRRGTAIVLIPTLLSACNKTLTRSRNVPDPVPAEIVVELESGERVELDRARLVGDSLIGSRNRLPLDQIVAVEYMSRQSTRTTLIVVGGLILVLKLADFRPLDRSRR